MSHEIVFPHLFVPWFRTVAPYIHSHKGNTFVIGVTGGMIAAGRLSALVQDLALIHAMNIKIVLVHGFNPQLASLLRIREHQLQYVNGTPITDETALLCAQEAAGQLRYQIEAAFSQGLPNTPMAHAKIRVVSGNFITAKPLGIVDGVNFQHTGQVRKLDSAGIRQELEQGNIVLLSSFGFSPTGETFNLSMEDVATETAIALHAEKLAFLTDLTGIPNNLNESTPPIAQNDSVPIYRQMKIEDAQELLQKTPKTPQTYNVLSYVRHMVKALTRKVERTHIIPYSVDGSLLIEVFTHDGIGTMIIDEDLKSLREARPDDIAAIIKLIEPLEQKGILVKRNRTDIERDINAYTVLEHDGVLFGCAAFHPYPKEKTAELAALNISQQVQGKGDGEKLLKHIEQKALKQGLESIFVLTTRTMHWFIKRGFFEVEPAWLPEEKLKKYRWDRKSKVLVKRLS